MKDSLGNTIPKNALIIRHTEVSTFRNCPRVWYITSQSGLNLEPKVKDKKLRFGTAWHRGLEFRHLGKDMKAGFTESALEQEREMAVVLGEGIRDGDIQAEIQEQRDLGAALIEAYVEWAETQANPSDKEIDILSTELRVVVPIPGVRAWLAARLDATVRYLGALWTMEHKTRSKSSDVTDPKSVVRDLQVGLQLLALRQLSNTVALIVGKVCSMDDAGLPVGGAIYNLARKQKPGPRVTNPIFGRHLVYYMPVQLTQLMTELRDVVVPEMRYAIRHPKVTMRRYNPGIGENSYCDWGCPATEVCEALNRNENVEYLLDKHFKPRRKNIFETLSAEMEE